MEEAKVHQSARESILLSTTSSYVECSLEQALRRNKFSFGRERGSKIHRCRRNFAGVSDLLRRLQRLHQVLLRIREVPNVSVQVPYPFQGQAHQCFVADFMRETEGTLIRLLSTSNIFLTTQD